MSRWNIGRMVKDTYGEEPPSWRIVEGVIVENKEDVKKFVKEFHFKEERVYVDDDAKFPVMFSLNTVLDAGASGIYTQVTNIRDHEKLVIRIVGFIEGDEDE